MHRLILTSLILFGVYGCAGSNTGDSPAVTEPTNSATATTTGTVEKIEKPAPVPAEPTPEAMAEQELRLGIAAYENGQHKKSQQSLKNALSLGLSSRSDKVTANKYLAFMTCANQQREVCKGYFRKAIAIDPKFELGKAEAGHPMWGKVFKEVKAEVKGQGAAK